MKDEKKKEQYEKLVRDIQNCHCCENIRIPIYECTGECLSNVDKEKYPEIDQANMWNYWQGSLDADIMMIGQDFGTLPKRAADRENREKKEKGYYSFEDCLNGMEWRTPIYDETTARDHWGSTDANIWHLFEQTFQMNVTEEQSKLFFTNMACCYRKNVISGNTNFRPEWLTLCANKHMGRLIGIIQPKIIITLGANVFNSLACVEDYQLVCENPIVKKVDKEKSDYEEAISHIYWLKNDNSKIRVFPVYHPGAYSTVNRPMTEQDMNNKNDDQKKRKKKFLGYQMKDWKDIADYYNKIKE